MIFQLVYNAEYNQMTKTRSQGNSQPDMQDDDLNEVDDAQSVQLSANDISFIVNKVKTDLSKEYDEKLEKLQSDYEVKIAHLEDKLTTVMNVQSDTNLKCIKEWISSLDKKIDIVTLELDVVKNDENVKLNKQGVINVKKLIDDVTERVAENERYVTMYKDKHVNSDQEFDTFQMPAKTQNAPVLDSSVSLKSLEERIDHLEDHSRRDNLLFYGFPEQKDENCAEKLKTMISNHMINTDDYDINFVRVHRLGRYSKQHTRPIIAKFNDYAAKTAVLAAAKAKTLESTDYAVSEDFSANTTKLRKALQSNIKGIKKKLGEGAELVFMRYKSLVVKDAAGKYRTFPASYILEKLNMDPEGTWYDGLLKDTVIVRGVNTRDKLG